MILIHHRDSNLLILAYMLTTLQNYSCIIAKRTVLKTKFRKLSEWVSRTHLYQTALHWAYQYVHLVSDLSYVILLCQLCLISSVLMQWNWLVKHYNCIVEVDLVAFEEFFQLVKPICELIQIICIKFDINYCAEFKNLVFLFKNSHFLQP